MRDCNRVVRDGEPFHGLQRGGETIVSHYGVDDVRRCTVYTTVYSIFVGPRPESVESADDRIRIELSQLREAEHRGILRQVDTHLDPIAGHLDVLQPRDLAQLGGPVLQDVIPLRLAVSEPH